MTFAVYALVVLPMIAVILGLLFSQLPIVSINPEFVYAIANFTGFTNQIAGFFPVYTLFTIVGLAISLEIGIVVLRAFLTAMKLTPKS